MKMIKDYVERIEEELEDAKNYAEKAVEFKVKNDTQKSTRYREMANDELKHAMYEHEWATKDIEELSKIYTPPVEMLEKWEKAHKKYIEQVAWIKQMLAM